MTTTQIETFARILTDDACGQILQAIETAAKPVKKISEECTIPLSTAYRKVNRLQETGLVVEEVRVSPSGNHTSVYRQHFDKAMVTLSTDGTFELAVESDEQLQSTQRPIEA